MSEMEVTCDLHVATAPKQSVEMLASCRIKLDLEMAGGGKNPRFRIVGG